MALAPVDLAPVEKKIGTAVVRLIQGDLTALDMDAFVFYAREDLQLGSGYGTAIQSRGGPAVKKALEAIGSIGMGEAVATTAGNMAARRIIHACGPKFQEPDVEGKLRKCLRSVLLVAQEQGVKTLALPPMGAGFYGVPLDLCARVMLEEIKAFLAGPATLEEVTICVVDGRDFAAFKGKLEAL